MKIQKYIKDKQNKYRVVIDDEEYILYDDVIIKYNLLLIKEIDNKTFKEMFGLNDELKSYYDSIKYISRKLRSEKEIYEYLEKKGIDESTIKKTIKRLRDSKFLNDDVYLNNNGHKKIEVNILKLGFREDIIKEKLSSIDESVWKDKLEKYIDKKIKTNHTSSSNMLKIKITNDLINLGFMKEDIISILNKKDLNDEFALKKEYIKSKRLLSSKYEGTTLENKIRERLFRKGFYVFDIKELDDEE